jgi:hypothetical protein
MPDRRHALALLREPLALCRLPAGAPVPDWAHPRDAPLASVTRTADELSVVCPASRVPEGVTASAPWRALRIDGPLDLSEVGVLAGLLAPLAEAGVSVFAIATYDTDYLLVREEAVKAAVEALRGAGHVVRDETE